jgi:hypothetical protein
MHGTNLLLARLPRKVLRDVAAELETVELVMGQVLHAPGDTAWLVHFPLRCVLSVLVTVEQSLSLEVAMVGCEGVEGFPLSRTTGLPFPASVQIGGASLQMGGAQLLAAMARHPTLDAAVHDHGTTLLEQIAINAGCNHFHLLEPRLARRLLMTRERAGSGTFHLTQEFLSTLLAVRREGISEAASSLQRQGLIEYHRGEITILNRAGLEAASCSCPRS